MLLLSIGLPGAGKGAIARKLKSFFNFEILATGEILRDAIADNTELGNTVKEAVLHGHFIDDTLAIKLVEPLLDPHKDLILDGFPRNLAQAKALDEILEHMGLRIDGVLYFDVDETNMKERIEGRRVCPKCHAVYHATNFPPKDGKHCDRCGTDVTKRIDDTPDNVATRIEWFERETMPLVDYYGELGLLKVIDANQSTMDMYYQVLESNQKFTNRSY